MKTYQLSKGRDKITGTAAYEIFSAGSGELTKADWLDGGAGIDKIEATLGAGTTAPVMRNIEYGVFYIDKRTGTLDLARTDGMSLLIFHGSTGDAGKGMTIANAASVSAMQLTGVDADKFTMNGLATRANDSFELRVSGPGGADVDLVSSSDKAFRFLDVALRGGPDLVLGGSAAGAKSLDVRTNGTASGFVTIDDDVGTSIRNLTLKGSTGVTVDARGDALSHLIRFDSQGAKDYATATIGGDHLTVVTGGRGSDFLTITSLGGDEDAQAEVRLGGGDDRVTLKFTLDSTTQIFDGGGGDDTIDITGAVTDFAAAIANFEVLLVSQATGFYDVGGLAFTTVDIFSVAGDISVGGLASAASFSFSEVTTHSVAIDVAGADGSTTDSLELELHLGAEVGSTTGGFSAENLSKLTIYATSEGSILYLTALGAADDGATVEITGGHKVTLRGTDDMATYIANLTVTDGSVDLSSLADYADAFLSTGATITGGLKADVLAGGEGSDTIDTGDGNNTVLGSLGADEVTLGTGSDTLVFSAQAQSSNDASHDTIESFDADEDVIDLSALTNPAEFQGTVANLAAGVATLSTTSSGAFFNAEDNSLYVDIDRDMDIDASDMRIVLTGVESLTSWNIEG